jgi:serine/threonine-protein kinase HipA
VLRPEFKYQNEGGPSIVDGFALVRKVTTPSAPNLLRLLDYIIFNCLVGNNDAHAKNFSLLYGQSGTQLAPLYDVLSTSVYPDLSANMAMKIGSKFRFDELHARHWVQMAEAAQLGAPQLKEGCWRLLANYPIWQKSCRLNLRPRAGVIQSLLKLFHWLKGVAQQQLIVFQ